MNSSGDQDSGVDLLVNDQVKIKTANTDRITVTDATTTVANNIALPTGSKLIGTDTGSIYAPGMVIQTIHGSTTTAGSTSSTSYVDTGLTCNITPKFSNSKILVMVKQAFAATEEPGTDVAAYLDLRRGTTQIDWTYVGDHTGDGSRSSFWDSVFLMTLDSPGTTSTTTYKTQYMVGDAGYTAYVQSSSQPSNIILQEIAQ